jgi:hypothetical protein
MASRQLPSLRANVAALAATCTADAAGVVRLQRRHVCSVLGTVPTAASDSAILSLAALLLAGKQQLRMRSHRAHSRHPAGVCHWWRKAQVLECDVRARGAACIVTCVTVRPLPKKAYVNPCAKF